MHIAFAIIILIYGSLLVEFNKYFDKHKIEFDKVGITKERALIVQKCCSDKNVLHRTFTE